LLSPETEAHNRLDEAVTSLRYKEVKSTSLERLKCTRQADLLVEGLPQPTQLGEGLYYLLDVISLPVSAHDLILGRISEEVPDEEGEAAYQEIIRGFGRRVLPSWMMDGGHECFAWDRLLRLGLSGLEEFARNELKGRITGGASGAEIDFLGGAVRVYQAFRHYARRYAAAAVEAGLDTPGANCANIAERPPETFAEALQLIWIVGHVYCSMVTMNATLTFGRMDEMLLPYYRKDISEGLLTHRDAGDLIEDFYCKNNLLPGRGEHQMGGVSE
jgi:hypothetical protein